MVTSIAWPLEIAPSLIVNILLVITDRFICQFQSVTIYQFPSLTSPYPNFRRYIFDFCSLFLPPLRTFSICRRYGFCFKILFLPLGDAFYSFWRYITGTIYIRDITYIWHGLSSPQSSFITSNSLYVITISTPAWKAPSLSYLPSLLSRRFWFKSSHPSK